ncbi:MAG: alpha/beta hydrolase [Myxococcales bacterium]
MRPVIVVHGIFDPAVRIMPLVHALRRRGMPRVRRARLPALGTTRIEVMAQLLAMRVAHVKAEYRCARVDLVGFSMGALVARAYLELAAGHEHIRTFVSISGPHRGTLTAHALPFVGVRQMRPRSELLRALGDDVGHFPDVRVHCLYTPFDAMIVPPTSGVLKGATSVHCLHDIPAHHRMLHDPRVHDLVAQLLQADNGDPQQRADVILTA